MAAFALYYEPSAFDISLKVMGRQASGAAFLQAVAQAQPEKLWCYASSKQSAVNCANVIARYGSPRTGIAWIPMDRPSDIAKPGLLYRPDPVLGPHAWQRLTHANPHAYSLCGIIHTISSHGAMSSISELLVAPLENWDALICTSRAGRAAVQYILEQQSEYLRERLGSTQLSLPQLPIVPLGVHTERFRRSADQRSAARSALGLHNDEIAVLFAGRLIAHGKAHPVPMYLALERAAQGKKIVLIQAGQAPNEHILEVFRKEPSLLCPSVRLIMVDGNDHQRYDDAWAAADIFTSLSDNFQETFGITPIEAMAAGLPVVVSDWNGYKDTVQDGVHGFRVPTLTVSNDKDFGLADRYDTGLINFDYYSGFSSQMVSIDVDAATAAYLKLFNDENLRRCMGEAGRTYAKDNFDWSYVYTMYQELWRELHNQRQQDTSRRKISSIRRRPDRSDPFRMFSSYPTHNIESGVRFRLRSTSLIDEANAILSLKSVEPLRDGAPSVDTIIAIGGVVARSWLSFTEICDNLGKVDTFNTKRAVVWMCKFGLLSFDIISDQKPILNNYINKGFQQ